jgi:hypothetical protein
MKQDEQQQFAKLPYHVEIATCNMPIIIASLED